jgi:hypothetical protein
MTNSTQIEATSALEKEPRDVANWAQGVSTLRLAAAPKEAINLNVDGRRVLGPLQGFGQMWEKTYRVRLRGAKVTPAEVIEIWKTNFQKFASPMLHFYLPSSGFLPGGVALINADAPGGIKISTGVMVLYADDESFSLITPQGHMFAGWITFSAFTEGDSTIGQVQVLIRASDPLFEVMMRLGGSQQEDKAWQGTLRALSAHFGVRERVYTSVSCVDPEVQWSQAGNILYNSALRSLLHLVTAPILGTKTRSAR